MRGGSPRHAGRFPSLVRRFATLIAEMNDAQRRIHVLRTAQDRYLPEPGKPPATYAEFLVRTSGALLHEPPARARISGRGVR
jgi:hypothetical protein